MFPRVSLLALLTVTLLGTGAPARAQQPSPQASPQPTPQSPPRPKLPIPPGLPRYTLDFRIDPAARLVTAREQVTFTNRSKVPVHELVFHIYPRYKVPDDSQLILAKTLEVLRLSPEEAMDSHGRRMAVQGVRIAGQPVASTYDPALDTILNVPLPSPLPPGQSVTAELFFHVELPDKWGRWGSYNGITYLVNWYPVLAYHDDRGWDRTPFMPWHQPFHQEAGHYKARVELPADQVVASTGRIVGETRIRPGWKQVNIETPPSRDFALVCSADFKPIERDVGGVKVRIVAPAADADNAALALDYAAEVIPLYERWFGPYYDDEFEIASSYFGWNGNECSGLVLLDERIFRMPSVGSRYLDHLVTHETCHQWWWNVVGTDGYAETFMDEGLVNCFTALRLDAKYGRNAPLIVWPRALNWLPTIGREDLRLASYYGWRARGGTGPVIQDLGKMGNLETLFSLAYDRGGKVMNMVYDRMGEDRYFAFFRELYSRHAYGMLGYNDLKTELAAFDPAAGWPVTLDNWLLAHNECDWSVEKVRVESSSRAEGPKSVTIRIAQQGSLEEPTVVLVRCGDQEIRVPLWPDRGSYDIPGAHVAHLTPDHPRAVGPALAPTPPRDDLARAALDNAPEALAPPPQPMEPLPPPAEASVYEITVEAPSRPTQVEIDPDHALLDARPDNNRWKPEVAWRLTPLVTPLDSSSWFQPYDRVGVVAGPFVDQYARAGFRAAAQRIERWQLSGWAGVEPSLSQAIFGGQGVLMNVPSRMWNLGLYYEEGLYNFHNDQRHSGGRAFLRKRLFTSSSFLVDDPAFFELYYGFGNEFWPGDDGRPTAEWLAALGGRFFRNTLFPYWDPVQGSLIEFAAERGDRAYGSPFDYTRLMGQYGRVWALPEEWGSLSRVRFALRAYGGYGWGDDHFLFRLGGGRRLRALNLQQEWGSSVWLVTSEIRFPIWCRIDRQAVDQVVDFKNLYGVTFVDVGQSYFNGEWGPLVFGPGVGLRLDLALFSFLERATVRLDLAQPIYGPGGRPAYDPGQGGPVLWFGLNQVF